MDEGIAEPDTRAEPAPGERERTVRWLAATLSVVAGAVHFGYAPHHLEEDWAHGWFFIGLGAFQLLFALAIVGRARRWVWSIAIAVNLAALITWIVSRSAGLPFGPEALRHEPVTAPDLLCAIFEIGIIVLGVIALAAPAALSRPTRDRISMRFTAGAIGTVAIVLGALMLTPDYTAAHAGSTHSHSASATSGTSPCELSGPAASPGQVATDAEGHSHRGPTEQVAISETERVALATQQTLAREAAARYPTVADAEAAGYRMSVGFVPCIGSHYTNPIFAIRFDPGHPSELLYDGTAPDSKIVGLSYLVWSPSGAPEGFAGANDHWHQHNTNGGLCEKRGVVIGAESMTAEDCTALGGKKISLDGAWMLHDWIVPGWECSWGVFAGECPELGGRTGGSAWDSPAPGSAGADLTGQASN